MIINSFPGYEYVWDEKARDYQNMYRGENVGKGGYVYVEEGYYGNVALLDIQSMHPSSIIALNYFGEYTKNFKDILDARIAIKHGDFDAARKMLDGRLTPYLTDKSSAKALSNALKTCLNSCYGLTAAKFNNPMRDNRNVNNIVALRGSLFMVNLKHEVQQRGYTVAHIKTDSIKIPDATPEIINFVMDYAKDYGYTFEHEATYEKMCIVNKSTYIAKYATKEQCEKLYGYIPDKNNESPGEWTATAEQFAEPYVFKTLFSREAVTFDDLTQTMTVTSALYLDMNEQLPDVSEYERELDKAEDKFKKGKISDSTLDSIRRELEPKIAEGHEYKFVGKVGNFCPIKPGCGGGVLLAKRDNKYDSANGAKDHLWIESDLIRGTERERDIDMSFFIKLVDAAVESISKYCDFEEFVSDDPYIPDFIPAKPTEVEELPFL